MRTKNVTQEVSIEYGEDTYSAEVTWELWRENYGEDADGNRGVMTNMCELVDIKNIKKNGVDISEEEVSDEVMDEFNEREPKGE